MTVRILILFVFAAFLAFTIWASQRDLPADVTVLSFGVSSLNGSMLPSGSE